MINTGTSGFFRTQLFQELDAVHVGHLDVQQDDLVVLLRGPARPCRASVFVSTLNPCREKIRRQAWQTTSSSSTTSNA